MLTLMWLFSVRFYCGCTFALPLCTGRPHPGWKHTDFAQKGVTVNVKSAGVWAMCLSFLWAIFLSLCF